jgi:dihydrolipoamide dehydrogenase
MVIGGGYIGVELGSVWNRLGSEVLVLEFLPGILPPSDREMAGALQKSLEKQGIKFRFNTIADSAQVSGEKVRVNFKTGDQTGSEEVDKVLVCVGRRPVTEGLGLIEAGVMPGPQRVCAGRFALRHQCAGDLCDRRCHRRLDAGAQGRGGRRGRRGDHGRQVGPCELCRLPGGGLHASGAGAGWTHRRGSGARGPIKIGKFPFTANGRARGMDETEGFVKVIGDAKNDRLLGVHILGADASNMIAEATLAMEFAASVEDVGSAFHAHPTMPEALREAALAANHLARQI